MMDDAMIVIWIREKWDLSPRILRLSSSSPTLNCDRNDDNDGAKRVDVSVPYRKDTSLDGSLSLD